MERVLFIVPPSIDFDKFKHPPSNVRTVLKRDGAYGSVLTDMPLGVLALSAYVKKHSDAEVQLIDFNVVLNQLDTFAYASFEDFFKEYLGSSQWRTFGPTIIGISTLFATSYRNMLDIAHCCRTAFPHALRVAGGGVPTNMYRNIYAESGDFDGLFFGEGERPLLSLILADDKQASLETSASCVTRKKLQTDFQPRFDFIADLDEVPAYDYSLVDLDDYRLNPTISAYPGADSSGAHVTYMTSRGCPFYCIFCAAHSVHGRKMRFLSLERVKQDFLAIKERYGVRTIVFQDDHFMASPKRAHAIIDLLKSLGMSAFFPNSLTLYALDRPMLEALRDVGVRLLVLAIESGSARVLKKVMRKPLNLKIAERVVRDCRVLGIDTDVNIVVGLPGENKQDIADARAFLRTLNATWFRIYTAIPLPGSEMYEICLEKGYIPGEVTDGDFKKAVIHTEEFTPEYIQRMAYTMNLDLNFVCNGEMRLGNYARALKEFENTIKLKDDHAFAYYFAAECRRQLGDESGYALYRERYEEIRRDSPFWREYAEEFALAPL